MDLSGADQWWSNHSLGNNTEEHFEIAGAWLKSRRSQVGGEECVEVAAAWRRSRRSSAADGQNCVEVAGTSRAVLIRDSKDTEGPLHAVTPEAFRSLLGQIKSGGLDL